MKIYHLLQVEGPRAVMEEPLHIDSGESVIRGPEGKGAGMPLSGNSVINTSLEFYASDSFITQFRGSEGAPPPIPLEFDPSTPIITQFSSDNDNTFEMWFKTYEPHPHQCFHCRQISRHDAITRYTLQFRKNMHQEMYLSQPLKISSQRIQIISFASLPLLVEIQESSKKSKLL